MGHAPVQWITKNGNSFPTSQPVGSIIIPNKKALPMPEPRVPPRLEIPQLTKRERLGKRANQLGYHLATLNEGRIKIQEAGARFDKKREEERQKHMEFDRIMMERAQQQELNDLSLERERLFFQNQYYNTYGVFPKGAPKNARREHMRYYY